MNPATAVFSGATAAGLAVVFLIILSGGENSNCGPGVQPVARVDAAEPVSSATRVHPVGGEFTISDVFGSRGGEHRGVDFAAPAGTPIRAVADGRVVAAGPASGFGHWIVIDSVDETGRRLSTVYGHMWPAGVFVRSGDLVTAGQHIGDVGSNGESSGPHLHFELVPDGRLTGGAPVDPVPWLAGATTPGPVAPDRCDNGFGTPGADLASGKVPSDLEPWFRRGGSLCSEIRASLLAAQSRQESGFRRGLTSPAGAQGIAQFLPSTATSINPEDGQPFVIDADGNGIASLWDDGDAIIGQARFMCNLAHQAEQWSATGTADGDVVALALAAYNAGPDAVTRSGGVPPFPETISYVGQILATEPEYRAPGAWGRSVPGEHVGVDAGDRIATAAREWIGTPYVWGGGGPGGPSNGGFDCSGLTSAAVFAATGQTLPRTSEQQWEIGDEIPLDQVRPGYLVFSEFGPRGPGHVAIASGAGQQIHAPQPGDHVREAPIAPGSRARRISLSE